MKSVLMVILIVLLVTSGCGQSGLDEYKNALDRTQSMESGTEEVKLSVQYQFVEPYLWRMGHWSPKYHMVHRFEKDASLFVVEKLFTRPNPNHDLVYFPPGYPESIEYSMAVFLDGSDAYLSNSAFPGYLKIESPPDDTAELTTTYSILPILGLELAIEQIAQEVEAATRIENIVLDNPDGLVKVRVFSLEVCRESAKEILSPIGFDQAEITEINYFAYLDKDNYIVREEGTIRLRMTRSPAPFRSGVITWKIDRYNINQDQAISYTPQGRELSADEFEKLLTEFLDGQFPE